MNIKMGKQWPAFASRCYLVGKQILNSSMLSQKTILSDDPRFVGNLLLLRTLSNFQGAITLAQRKLVVEARILTRCCFENLFTVVTLQEKGSKFVKRMDADREANRRARGEFLLKYGDEDDALRIYLRKLPKSKAKLLSPKTVAAGPLERGYAYYAQLSADAAHPGLDALERYISKSGNTLQVNLEPIAEDEEIDETVNLACQAMIGVAVHVNTMIGGPDDPELLALIQEMR